MLRVKKQLTIIASNERELPTAWSLTQKSSSEPSDLIISRLSCHLPADFNINGIRIGPRSSHPQGTRQKIQYHAAFLSQFTTLLTLKRSERPKADRQFACNLAGKRQKI